MTRLFSHIYDSNRSDSWATKLRNQRLIFFQSLISNLPKPITILDVGGKVSFWESMGFLDQHNRDIKITVLNANVSEMQPITPKVEQIIGDARNMKQFKNQEFDIVFSNSVIEHVGTYAQQSQMANEVMRVGKRYFIQTPNLYFPIEPHFVFPFFQFLPIPFRIWLVSHFSLGWFNKISDPQKASQLVNAIKLLEKKKFLNLFPGAKLYEEKFFGLTKSFIVYGGW